MQLEKNSKIVGVTHKDDNGTERQDNCRKVVDGQKLYVVLETNNAFDPQAMKIFADEALQLPLGYVQRELAKDLQTQMQQGWSYEVFATKRTGGERGKSTGVNIRIVAHKAE
jgi:hypothetical protein